MTSTAGTKGIKTSWNARGTRKILYPEGTCLIPQRLLVGIDRDIQYGYEDNSSTGATEDMTNNFIVVAQTGEADFVGSTGTVIQQGINEAISSGRRLLIKKGTYTISSTLTCNGHVQIYGEGTEQTELKAAAGLNGYIIKINSTNSANQYRTVFNGFKIDGTLATSTGGGIISYGGIESIYQNLHFENCYDYGLWLYDCGGGSGSIGHHNRITCCLFDQAEGSGGIGAGLYMRNNDENTILQSEFQYLKYGIKDETGFNRINSCSFVDGETGIYILDCSRTGITNCVFDYCAQYGIRLKGAFCVVNACTFYRCSDGSTTYDCILIDYYGSNSITGNMFVAENNSTKCNSAIKEAGNAAEDTYQHNLIDANYFVSTSSATTLQGSSNWATAALVQANTNDVGTNITRTA